MARFFLAAFGFLCLTGAAVLSAVGSDGPPPLGADAGGPAAGGRARAVGAHTVPVIGDTLAIVGEWTDSIPWSVIAINTHLLPSGKVLAWGAPKNNWAKGVVWDPADDSYTDASLRSANLFCSGHSFLPDGRLLVTGGHISSQRGLQEAHIYDPTTNDWAPTGDMNAGRWYPTNTTLPSGEVLVVSGGINLGVRNMLPQVWQPGGSWRDLSGAMLKLSLYPWMHVAPNGWVFNSGPDNTTRYLDPSGTGAWVNVGPRYLSKKRQDGTAVMYDSGKVIVIGGGDPPTKSAEVIDLKAPAPAWRLTDPMSVARRQHNATLLPDGKVLVTGGTSGAGFNDAAGAVFAAEVWDPETELWTTLASARVRRLYHSTAILLPDARVLSGGGGRPPGTNGSPPDKNHSNVEIFSPPYLFGPGGLPAVRPMILSAPGSVAYGETFFVETPAAVAISKVTWIGLSSVTHRFNMGQRFNRLPFTLSPSGLDVTAPPSANVAPPGHYMLFLLDANGVPSVAKIVRIG